MLQGRVVAQCMKCKARVTCNLGPDHAHVPLICVFDVLRLASACITINEMPFIRFSHSSNGIAELVAKSLNRCLKAYKAENPSFVAVGDTRGLETAAAAGVKRAAGLPLEPATVIIVDRVDDLGPALMHDITYSVSAWWRGGCQLQHQLSTHSCRVSCLCSPWSTTYSAMTLLRLTCMNTSTRGNLLKKKSS
jgi:hypothetical protein